MTSWCWSTSPVPAAELAGVLSRLAAVGGLPIFIVSPLDGLRALVDGGASGAVLALVVRGGLSTNSNQISPRPLSMKWVCSAIEKQTRAAVVSHCTGALLTRAEATKCNKLMDPNDARTHA